MSPLLFILYICELDISDTDDPKLNACYIISMLFFADDFTFFSHTVIGLQRKLNRLQRYCEDWRLLISLLKTVTISFGSFLDYSLTIYDKELKRVTEYKINGFFLTSNLKSESHFRSRFSKATSSASSLMVLHKRMGVYNPASFYSLFRIIEKSDFTYVCKMFNRRFNDNYRMNISLQTRILLKF